MAYLPPTAEQAQMIAELLDAGVTPTDAVRVANPDLDPVVVPDVTRRWVKDAAVRAAQVVINGGDWRQLTAKQRIEKAQLRDVLELAYLTYAGGHYGDLTPESRKIRDTARTVIAAYVSGTSGKADVVAEFIAKFQKDLKEKSAGKLPIERVQ